MDLEFSVDPYWLTHPTGWVQIPIGLRVAVITARVMGLHIDVWDDPDDPHQFVSLEEPDYGEGSDWYRAKWYLGQNNDYWLFQHDDERTRFTLRFRYADAELTAAVKTILTKRFNWRFT